MNKPSQKYNIPIWLSDWTLKDGRGKTHHIYNAIVKGADEEDIINNLDIVNKVVNKLKRGRKKLTLKATNLALKSQHGYGIDDN
jgi:protein-arginine kinase